MTLKLETINEFATNHQMPIPQKKAFEPECLFNWRYSSWQFGVESVMSHYYATKGKFNANMKMAKDYSKMAQYAGENIFSYVPDFEGKIDFSLSPREIISLLKKTYTEQVSLNISGICHHGIIGQNLIRRFFSIAIENMPSDKKVVVIKNPYTPTSEQEATFEQELHNLQDGIQKEAYIACYSILFEWYAFVPSLYTSEELEALIESFLPSTAPIRNRTRIIYPKDIFQATVEYR